MIPAISNQDKQRLQTLISADVKQQSGKGPQSVQITFSDSRITVIISGFFTPIEQVLRRQGRGDLIHRFRDAAAQVFAPLWEKRFYEHFNLRVKYVEGFTDIENEKRLLVFSFQ